MRHPDANAMLQLTKKLEKYGDISLQEADWIFSLFSANSLKTKLNPASFKADKSLMEALKKWFAVVASKIERGYSGNFIFTILLPNGAPDHLGFGGFRDFIQAALSDAEKSLKKYGRPEDLLDKLLIDQKTFLTLPEKLQQLFNKGVVEDDIDNFRTNKFYELRSPRAGLYYYPFQTKTDTYTIAQFMQRFAPVAKVYSTGRFFFEITSGAREISQWSWRLGHITWSKINQRMEYVIAAYIKHKNIPGVIMSKYGQYVSATGFTLFPSTDFVFLCEKDKVRFMKGVFEIPLREIVSYALNENIIDQTMAQNLLNNNYYWDFPVEAFVQAGTEYIDQVVRTKLEWKATRNTIEDEPEWLEEIR
jgi:hypothetical protein